MPKVSVLMPVFNTDESFLRESIESILNQTYKDFEFIIINDGSTNNAKDVILSYNDERIVYIENEHNLKLIKTLNKGVSIAKGEYIVRMDSDDISLESRIEKSVLFMDSNQDVVAAGTHAIGIPKRIRYKAPSEDIVIKPFLRYIANCMMHPCMIIRTSALKNNNLSYDENYIHNEDFKLWIELNKKGKLSNIPEELLYHRIHENAISVEFAQLQQEITNKILWENLLEDFAPKNKKLKNIAQKIYNKNELTAWEFHIASTFLAKIVVKLRKNFTADFHPYIHNVYRNNLIKLIKLTTPSTKCILAIMFSKLVKVLGENKMELINLVIEKMEKELGVKRG